MGDIFIIVIIVVALGILGGTLYLIYLPVKYGLKKAGKLTPKLNNQVNRIFIISLCLFGVILYCFKDYRASSKDRLESISDVKLPKNFKVIKDEYQDMLQDYSIFYDIQFNNNETTELIKNVKSSKFYTKKEIHNGVAEKDFVTVDSVKAVWYKTTTGFRFLSPGRTTYYIELDTLTNILKYKEYAD